MERRPLLLTASRKYGSFSKEEMREKIPRGNPRMLIVVTSSCLTFFLLFQLHSLLLHQPAGGGLTSSLMTGTVVVSAPMAGLVTARSGSRTVSILGSHPLTGPLDDQPELEPGDGRSLCDDRRLSGPHLSPLQPAGDLPSQLQDWPGCHPGRMSPPSPPPSSSHHRLGLASLARPLSSHYSNYQSWR